MNPVMNFSHSIFGNIRAIDINGKLHFVGVDVARSLKYANPSKAVIDHCKGVSKLGIPSDGGIQETNVIPEGDMYRLIVKAADQSKSQEVQENASRFEHWVFDEVLPSIRQTGNYGMPRQLSRLELIDLARESEIARLEAEKQATEYRFQLREQAPMVFFAEAVTTSHTSILVRELAVLLRQNGVDIGEKRLYEQLRGRGYLIKRKGTDWNMPTQRSMDLGLFEVKETPIHHNTGSISVGKTPKVTGKGQVYFVNLFKRELVQVEHTKVTVD